MLPPGGAASVRPRLLRDLAGRHDRGGHAGVSRGDDLRREGIAAGRVPRHPLPRHVRTGGGERLRGTDGERSIAGSTHGSLDSHGVCPLFPSDRPAVNVFAAPIARDHLCRSDGVCLLRRLYRKNKQP